MRTDHICKARTLNEIPVSFKTRHNKIFFFLSAQQMSSYIGK